MKWLIFLLTASAFTLETYIYDLIDDSYIIIILIIVSAAVIS